MKGLGAACGCVGRCAVIGVRPYGQRVSIPGASIWASIWASLGEFGRELLQESLLRGLIETSNTCHDERIGCQYECCYAPD